MCRVLTSSARTARLPIRLTRLRRQRFAARRVNEVTTGPFVAIGGVGRDMEHHCSTTRRAQSTRSSRRVASATGDGLILPASGRRIGRYSAFSTAVAFDARQQRP